MRNVTLALAAALGSAVPAAPMMKSALPWSPSLGDEAGWEQFDHGMAGQWEVGGGLALQNSLSQEGLSESAWTALLGPHAFGDVALRAGVKLYGAGDSVGLVFGWRDADNHWRVRLSSDWTRGGESVAVLEHVVSGEVQEIARRAAPPPFDVVELSVDLQGRAMQVRQDERLLIGNVDLPEPVMGRAGLLATGASKVSFRRVAAEAPRDIRPQITMGPWMSNVTPDSVTVSWIFDRPMRAQVWLGPEQSEYSPLDLPELGGAPHEHWEVTIPGLTPGQRHLGRILYEAPTINGTLGWDVAGNFSFRTAPADASASFRVGICSDNQVNTPEHRRVTEALAAERPDVAINVGDLVNSGQSAHAWRAELFELSATLLASVPTFAAIGNHEQDADTFYGLFPHPGRRDWYAVTYGSMRLVVLDSNQPVRPGSPQMDWLREEVSSEAFGRATWRVAAFHHPAFTQGWDNPDYDGEPAIREHLWPVLRDARFHLILNGHTHDYERGALDGVTMVITGGGGAALDHFEQPWPFMQVYEAAYQFCLMDVTPESLVFTAKTPEGRVIDRFTLTP